MAGEDFSRIFSSLLVSLRSQKIRDDSVTKIDENILLGELISHSFLPPLTVSGMLRALLHIW